MPGPTFFSSSSPRTWPGVSRLFEWLQEQAGSRIEPGMTEKFGERRFHRASNPAGCLPRSRVPFNQSRNASLMHRNKTLALAAAALGLAALAVSSQIATAAPAAKAVIAARHANFEAMGKSMKAIKGELDGSADKARITAAAKVIAAQARKQIKLFPAGTGPASGLKTDALPDIWTRRAAFDEGMQKLIVEADKLAAVAARGDADATGAQFKAVGGTCGSCHRQFRAEH